MNEKKLILLFAAALLIVGAVYFAADRKFKKEKDAPAIDVSFNDGPALPNDEEVANLPKGTPLPALAGTWVFPDGKTGPAPDYSGKVVLVDVWSVFCPPCIESIPANNKLVEMYSPKGLYFIGATPNPPAMLTDFKKKNELNYPLLSMAEAELGKTFKLEFFPTMFLFNKEGKLVWAGSHIMNLNGKLQSAFSKALKTALGGESAPEPKTTTAAEPDGVALPPEFAKILAKAEAAKGEPEVEPGLKLGDALPSLQGDWIAAGNGAPDLKDKVLLIDFFTTVCGSCVEAIPHNNKIHARFAPRGFVFVNATPEKKELIAEFKKARAIDYPVLTNCEKLFKTCEIEQLPVTLLFNRQGKLVWKGTELQEKDALLPDFEKAVTAALEAK